MSQRQRKGKYSNMTQCEALMQLMFLVAVRNAAGTLNGQKICWTLVELRLQYTAHNIDISKKVQDFCGISTLCHDSLFHRLSHSRRSSNQHSKGRNKIKTDGD